MGRQPADPEPHAVL